MLLTSNRQISTAHYDVVIAGGGILGSALAWEASLRGVKVLLLERGDFGSGTSANSLKIIHGGLRYLQTGDLGRARRSAREQELLCRMAPHLMHVLPCLVPAGTGVTRGKAAFALGLGFYNAIIRWGLPPLSGNKANCGLLTAEQLAELAPLADYQGVSGGAYWEDVRIEDPVRLVLEFIESARDLGADCFNYKEVTAYNKSDGVLDGVTVIDGLSGGESHVNCNLLIDATTTGLPGQITGESYGTEWCKAVNLGLDLPAGKYAFGVNAGGGDKDEKRFLFLTPWRGVTAAGTWYFPGSEDNVSPVELGSAELDQCLDDINSVLKDPIGRSSVLYVDIGCLPMAPGEDALAARLLDEVRVVDGESYGWKGYIRPLAVKYTTARQFAESVVDRHVGKVVSLQERKVVSLPGARFETLGLLDDAVRARLPTGFPDEIAGDLVRRFGSQVENIVDIMITEPALQECVPTTRTTLAELQYVCDFERVETAADVILHRTGMGAVGRPANEAIDHVLDYLSEKRGWSDERRTQERSRVEVAYQRIAR